MGGSQKVQKCGSCNCHMIESDLEGNPGGYLYGEKVRCESLDCSRFSLSPREW